MFGLGSLRLGRLFGIQLFIHPTFWLLPLFVFLSGGFDNGWSSAAFDTALLLAVFGCVVLHEFGHALAAARYGIRTRDITLYPIGGAARLERMPERPGPEIAIALAGPAVNVAIAAALAAVLALTGSVPTSLSTGLPTHRFLNSLMWSNVGLVLFNLIPAFPMDGGRVLRATLSWFVDRVTATTAAAWVGTVIGVLMIAVGLLSHQYMLAILAGSVIMFGQQEAWAVRAQAENERRRRLWEEWDRDDRGYGDRPPVVRQVAHAPADGWAWDPHSGEWTEYRDGRPVRVLRR